MKINMCTNGVSQRKRPFRFCVDTHQRFKIQSLRKSLIDQDHELIKSDITETSKSLRSSLASTRSGGTLGDHWFLIPKLKKRKPPRFFAQTTEQQKNFNGFKEKFNTKLCRSDEEMRS